MEALLKLWETIRPHLSTIVLVLTWLGIAFAYYRKRSRWYAKQFIDQVNFSLNYVVDATLQLRTLLETSTREVWLNDYGVRLVLAAAKQTRADQPFIILNDPVDMAFVKRAALNVLSEKFASAFLATAIDVPVKTGLFQFAITFENFADMRTRKFRVLIVEAQSLVDKFGPGAPEPTVLDPNHRDRLTVLQAMAKLAANPASDTQKILGRVQLGIPV